VEIDGRDEFVGRELELRALLAGLEEASAGRGGLFLIGGEPGIGKSRLADHFSGRAREAGARVLWGRCWEGAGAPAYWPWIQALRAYLRTVDPAVAREQLGSGAAAISQILPEIRALLPDVPPAPPDSDSARFQLFDSTASFLRNVVSGRETLLVLDDLHAADTPSILLLRFLATQLGEMRVVIVATYRDIALTPDHPLTATLAELAREPTTRILLLEGLREEVVGRFIEGTAGVEPTARLAREMWRETSGNPLFLREAVRLLVSERRLNETAGGATLRLSVPASVREVIARRVGQLPAPTVEALTIGAALGPEFAGETLRRVGGYGTRDLLGRLDEAVREGLLAPVTGAAGRFRFSHDLVRESLYQDQSPVEGAHLHRRIAEALEELYGSSAEAHLAELAHHFFEAAQGADETDAAVIVHKARTYAARAAEVATRALAYEEAARLFRTALAVLDLQAASDDAARTELLLSLGDAEARAGDMESATAPFLEAADLARRTGVAAHLARAALGIGGRVPWARPGRNSQLIPLLEEALVLLGGDDQALRVRLLARLACAWRSSPDKRQQSDILSRQALETARQLGDPATLSYALVARCWATWWPENPEDRVQLADEMIAVARVLGDAERLIDAHLMRALSLTEYGRTVEVTREIAEVGRLADELRQPTHLWLGFGWRALFALMEG
ncbi:MAG: AAA family ATPase, partial [Chloroflexota bacterium]|nr:AAA family ATPase [Chloroflexota bacterium]